MPLTQREIIKHLNLPPGTSPWDRINIDMAAYYQSRQMAAWSSPRPDYERWRLGLGSYNAGLGSLLKAQKACGGARLWRVIETCLPQITGGNAHETQTYVVRIERWWRELGGCAPFAAPRELQGEWGCP